MRAKVSVGVSERQVPGWRFTGGCGWLLILLLVSGAGTASAQQHPRVKSGRVEVGLGQKLYYEMAGKGRTVVLIHGGLADSRLWDDQFRAFARHFRVVRYDL
ncbi:MAG TPA: hypothetical protein VGC64_03360, partial [Pyrinomonadaceae bacterium]